MATCGCRGIRKCLICELNKEQRSVADIVKDKSIEFYQCYNCGNMIDIQETVILDALSPLRRCKRDCNGEPTLYPPGHVTCSLNGTVVFKEFISVDEELFLIRQIDESGWAESQSGRRKQDFGPKVNFKKAKVKIGSFNGFPSYSKELVTRLVQLQLLQDFVPVELCNLDYDPCRGSAIDPHLDDSWIWGERLVTINLLSDTYLTFTHPSSFIIHVPLPRRSLVIVMGVARHEWSHSISRCNVLGRRVAMTMRELGMDFTDGNKNEEIGHKLVKTASRYNGTPVNFQ